MALRNLAEFAPPKPPLGRLPGVGRPAPGVGGRPDPDPPKFGRDTPCCCRHWRNEELSGPPFDRLDPDEGVDELLAAEHPVASTAASSTGPATRQHR
jgi:hypothetical protein